MQIISAFQHSNQPNPNVEFVIESTCESETQQFGSNNITSDEAVKSQALQQVLQVNKLRRNYQSGILYFESDRSIAKVNPLAFSFDYNDPYLENISWNVPMQPLKGRWTDTQHTIFKKVLALRSQLGSAAIRLGREGKTEMSLGFSDPVEPYKEAFEKLLSPKKLVDPDLQAQKLMYEQNGEKRSIDTLSSGEKEVLNISFDFILRKPSDCIIFFDEPELHLHPELLNRLIKTLQEAGKRNQFFLISHSPEVIASSLDDTVIFLTPEKLDGGNQATILKPNGETTEAPNRLGQSVGVVALGKKIVLIEGQHSSLDKKTYSSIVGNAFPELVLLPSGGKDNLRNFDVVTETILDKTLWGIDFFMLADRDNDVLENSETHRFKLLPRYHLENHFLDSNVIASCFAEMESSDSWLVDPQKIEDELQAIAASMLSYVASLSASQTIRMTAGNVDLMLKKVHSMDEASMLIAAVNKASEELNRVEGALDSTQVENTFRERYAYYSSLLTSGEQGWKHDFPAKQVFAKFCGKANISVGRVKSLYITNSLKLDENPFKEIYAIFDGFAKS